MKYRLLRNCILKYRFPVLLFLLAACTLKAFPQQTTAWSKFLDPSRAIDWSSTGFTIPNYTNNCSVQPSLTTGSGAASANAASIQKALASCDSSHNVVNIPAGTYYSTGINYGTQGNQVLRGAGPNSTTLIFTSGNGCAAGFSEGICMKDSAGLYNGSSQVLPGGSNQCLWTAGYAQGSTSITLSSCGGTPPAGKTIILDQANDTSDTNGIYICDTNSSNCGYEGTSGGNNDGRSINGVTHSEQEVTRITGVTSNGSGSYTVTISPGVYFTNIRSGQSPGAWWPGTVVHDGLENMTLDGSSLSDSTIGMYDCYQCWVTNVRSINAGRNHIELYQSADDIIRDDYFYESQSHYSESYVVEAEESSGFLVENNIFQQVTNPLMFGQASGAIISYNYGVDDLYSGSASYAAAPYTSHNAGNEMNLWEGNDFLGIWADDAWGSSSQNTFFRNLLTGWESGKTAATVPILLRNFNRAYNVVGNVLGEPGYHTQYQTYSTSTSGGVGAASANTSIYNIGWGGTDAVCSSGSITTCDPITVTSLMRWGNYDTVNGAVKWDSTYAAPAAIPHLNANFTSSYFSSLAHTLPTSLYDSSQPSWWPSGEPWPPIGPNVSGGNLGICKGGTYAGAEATSATQCTGGTLVTAWGGHANAIPAQNCYLNVMHGPPDGSGGELSFDPSKCYPNTATTSGTGASLASPVNLVGTVTAN